MESTMFSHWIYYHLKDRGLRRQMRFRRAMVQEQTRFKNSTAGLLTQTGVEYERRRLHGKRYFQELMQPHGQVATELRPLLDFNRQQIEALGQMDQRLVGMLEKHPLIGQRIAALQARRNAHLQSVLIETAKLAPTHNENLKALYQKRRAAGADDNLATLEVARKLVAYLLAADRACCAIQLAASA